MSQYHGPASSDSSSSSSASSPTTQSTAAAAAADATSSVVFTLMSSALIGDRILQGDTPVPTDLILMINEYAPFDWEWRRNVVVEMLQPMPLKETELAERDVNCVKEIKRVQSHIDDIAMTLPAESSVDKLLRSAVVVKGSTLELGGSEYTIDFPSIEVSVRGAKNGDSPNQQPLQIVHTEPSRLKVFNHVWSLGYYPDGDSHHDYNVCDKDDKLLFELNTQKYNHKTYQDEIVLQSEGLREWLKARGVLSERIVKPKDEGRSDNDDGDDNPDEVFVRKFALLLLTPMISLKCLHRKCSRCTLWWLEQELFKPRRNWYRKF